MIATTAFNGEARSEGTSLKVGDHWMTSRLIEKGGIFTTSHGRMVALRFPSVCVCRPHPCSHTLKTITKTFESVSKRVIADRSHLPPIGVACPATAAGRPSTALRHEREYWSLFCL